MKKHVRRFHKVDPDAVLPSRPRPAGQKVKSNAKTSTTKPSDQPKVSLSEPLPVVDDPIANSDATGAGEWLEVL
jgi:hypothetical protein